MNFSKFWFLTNQEKDKGKLDCPTLPEEKAPKISFSPLQLIKTKPGQRPKIFLS